MNAMVGERGFSNEVEALRRWLKDNAPAFSQSFEQVLDAEVAHHPQSHILYTLIMCAFDAGRDFERNTDEVE